MRSRTPGMRLQRPAARGCRARRPICAALPAILALALVCAGPANAAAPGSLDPAFGSGGVASLGVGTQLFGVAVQPNGQPVAAGQSGGKVLVERFTTAGQPSGVYVGPAGYARAVAIQSDGKIVIAGSSGGAMLVERLTSSLKPDSSFGSGGIVSVFGGQFAIANAVGIGSDGSIATAGSVNPPNTQVGAARLSANGHVQWSKVLNLGNYSVATGLAVQPADDKIVLVGRQAPSQITNAVVARLTASGSLDSSFAGVGALTYSVPKTGYTSLNSVTLQRDGRIVAAGNALPGQPVALFLRITSNGHLDSSFGAGGAATLPAGDSVTVPNDPIGAYGVGIAAGGRIVGAGNYEHTGVEVDAAAYALTANGSPQPGFGTGGVVRAPTGAIESCSLAVAPNGNLIAAGDAVATFPNKNPCSPSSASNGFVASYVGFGPVGPPPPPPPPPALKVTLTGLKSSYKKSDVAKNGLTFGVSCNRSCSIKTTLVGSAALAKRLHIGKTTKKCKTVRGKRRCVTVHHYKPVTLASAQGRLGAAGVKTFLLKTALLSRAMGLSGTVTATLNVGVTPPPSTKQTSLKRVLTFK